MTKSDAKTIRLVTIPISPFCEKARWALERAAIPYVEDGHLQVLHYRAVKRAGGDRTVPVLVAGDQTVTDSTEILSWVDMRLADADRLFPNAVSEPELEREVAQLEAAYDDFGADTRLLAYQLFLVHPVFATRFLLRFQTIPLWQRTIAPLFLLPMSRVIKRRYSIDQHSAASARERIVKVLDQVAERVCDGRRFLCAERFTAADLTFACHSSALSLPPEYGAHIARFEELPRAARRAIAPLHQHPACDFARRLFREERHRIVGGVARRTLLAE